MEAQQAKLKRQKLRQTDAVWEPQDAWVGVLMSRTPFSSLSLCEPTLQALQESALTCTTQFQAKALSSLLAGKDILGVAPTGSGKTLAYLIPCVEVLYRKHFVPSLGTGAVVISPTREHARQIYDCVCVLMKHHAQTYGIVTGGCQRQAEAAQLSTGVNLLVATPTRLLDHLRYTRGFVYCYLACLVVDEVDRILRYAANELRQIVQLLPEQRQTMLFSGTPTTQVEEMEHLFSKHQRPQVIEAVATLEGVVHRFCVASTADRFLLLFTLLSDASEKKVVVVLSTDQSVQYLEQLLNSMGLGVLHIHNKQNAAKRNDIRRKFRHADKGILLCTEARARAKRLPAVDFVVQFDVPDDARDYVTWAGRITGGHGRALLLLMPHELGFLKYLLDAEVSVAKHHFAVRDRDRVQAALVSVLKSNSYLQQDALTAYSSYMEAYKLHKLKDALHVDRLDPQRAAYSFGLALPPKVNGSLEVQTPSLYKPAEPAAEVQGPQTPPSVSAVPTTQLAARSRGTLPIRLERVMAETRVRLYRVEVPSTTASATISSFFIDQLIDGTSTTVIGFIEYWLGCIQLRFGHPPEAVTVGHLPLYINGLVKTGKSYTLNVIVAAVAAAHRVFGVGRNHEMKSYDFMLRNLLAAVVNNIEEQGVTVAGSALQEATRLLDGLVPARHERVMLPHAIKVLFRSIRSPMLVLADEIQKLFLPKLQDGSLDNMSQRDAQLLSKQLLCYSSNWVAWAVTGGSLGVFWANIAKAPLCGVAMLQWNRKLDLPAVSSKDTLQVAWQQLRAGRSYLPYKLGTAVESVALLSEAAFLYSQDRMVDLDEHVSFVINTKVMVESIADYQLLLMDLSNEQRHGVLELTIRSTGAVLDRPHLQGLLLLMDGLTEKVPGSNRVFLTSAVHRGTLQVLADAEGNLRSDWHQFVHGSHPGVVDAYLQLQLVGNKATKAQTPPHPNKPWEGPFGSEARKFMEDLAVELEKGHGPARKWQYKRFFRKVWFHSYNQGGASTADVAGEGGIRGGTAAWYLRDCKGLTPGLHLAFYLRMLRNVLAHEEAALQPQPYLSASSTHFRSAVNHVASFPFAEAFADVYIMFKPLLTEFADGR